MQIFDKSSSENKAFLKVRDYVVGKSEVSIRFRVEADSTFPLEGHFIVNTANHNQFYCDGQNLSILSSTDKQNYSSLNLHLPKVTVFEYQGGGLVLMEDNLTITLV